MIVSFLIWSTPSPIGGVVVLYRFANALAERGHEVHLLHRPYHHLRIEGLDDLAWFDFHPSIEHHLIDEFEPTYPPADVIVSTGAPPEAGLPVHVVQGKGIVYTELDREGFRRPSLKIAVASWLTDAGERWGWPAERCHVVHVGLDHETFRVRLPIADRPPRVAILHHTHPTKGWGLGLRAIELARQQVPELTAVAFGTFEPDGDVPDWVDFRGEVDHDELAIEILGRSAVFVQASGYEGFGLPAVEAMACGCALVTADNGGSRDYARHEDTALVTPRRDPRAMAEQIVRLLRDSELRTRIATAGVAEVARFRWSETGRRLEELFLDYTKRPEAYLLEPGPERPELSPEGSAT